MHNTVIHHLLTDAQPTPNSDQFLLANFPWLYTANLLYGISLWPAWAACPVFLPHLLTDRA